MSRILIAWEMGHNLGHLSRLVPLATRLKSRGHSVLAVVRDVAAASATLGPENVTFIQSPQPTGVQATTASATGYADLLLSQGWSDQSALWGMLKSWITLYGIFQPEVVVLDYAPTARLAAIVCKIPTVLIGTGFELPPATDPLPCFPGISGATRDAASVSEQRVLKNVNAVLRAFHVEPLGALRPLVEAEARFLATFAELDHYGLRQDEQYIGPLADPRLGRAIEWPTGSRKRVFAYLRPEGTELPMILEGLATAEACVIAYVPGVPRETLARFSTSRCVFSAEPVRYATVFEAADACVSYAPAGTVTTALLNGVPQLMLPVHRESQLTAQRVRLQGLGRILRDPQSPSQVKNALHELLSDTETRLRARGFAERHQGFSAANAAGTVVEAIEFLRRDGFGRSKHPRCHSTPAAAMLQ
jgi:UDP:flavonoid glycosyltransferase YjiC (YdhE family)